ncbi:unnamed protein product [Caenorhabditis nigoni]
MNYEKECSRINMSNSQITHVIKKYIPEKLMNCVKLPPGYEENVLNAEEMVQAILSNFDNMLRMYGTARELLLNQQKFLSFPLSHRHFGFDYKDLYNTIPIAYLSMAGLPFMNKTDAFYCLQSAFLKDKFETPKSFDLFCSMQAILLKSYEEKITGVCEYFEWDGDWFNKLHDGFSSYYRQILTQESSKNCEYWNFEKALGMFKALLPVWNQREYCEFEKDLKTFFDSKSGNFNDVNVAIISFAEYLKGYISVNPEKFLPYDKETNPSCPITVRVFKSQGVQFVMKSELFNAINIRNPDSKRLEWKEIDGKLMTMSFEKVQRIYKDRIENIEFIKYHIQRTNHKSVPIMTPSGDYCILATDFLFEILNEFIFSHRFFQKIRSENWDVLRRFFLQMTNFFSPHHKSIFFVTLKEQDKQKEEMIKLWEQFENIPAKYVRNAKADGFTVQNLKNELANLGLTETFPEIQDYAESVYSEVFKAKREEFLRTCDLFKAVEKCLLHSIFKLFPTLHLFLHTQNACHLLPNLRCDFCIPPNTNRFKNTIWREPPYMKMSSTYSIEDPENTYLYQVNLPDEDMDYSEKNMEELNPLRRLDEYRYGLAFNLDAFQKFYPEKKIYIRTIPSVREKREQTRRVFAEEVLEMIPVVLRQQNTPIEENDDRLAKYRKKWGTNNKEFETTISLTEFWYILEEFDVDKTRITIIPDPVYELTVPKMVSDMRMLTLNVISPHGEQVMRSEQAVFHIFQVVYCSVNWTTDLCKKHENCLKELKDKMICSMRTYSELDEGTYVTVAHVESAINQLKNHCSFKLQSQHSESIEEIISNCRKLGLIRFLSALTYSNSSLEAFDVRIHYLCAFHDEFFYCENPDLYALIWEEIAYRSPLIAENVDLDQSPHICTDEPLFVLKPDLDEMPTVSSAEKEIPKKTKMEEERSQKAADIAVEKVVEAEVKKDSEAIKKDAFSQRTAPDDIQKTSSLKEALEVKKPTLEGIQKTSASEKAPEVETSSPDETQKTSVLDKALVVKPSASDDVQETPPTEKIPDLSHSKNCAKCHRTSEMCNEAKKELKMTQNRLEKYEKKAKRTEDVEKELKALKLEMKKKLEEAERRELEMGKKQKENDELKMKVSRLEANETRMRLNEKNHSILEKEQSEKIDELTAQFEHQKEIVQIMELQIQQNEERLNSEIRQKERGFEELRAALSIMSTEMESIQRDNRNLRNQIASIPEAPPTPTVPESSLEGQTHHRFALLRFQKIKDSLYHKKQLKQAKEMIEKLKSSSDLVEIHQIADYEYYQFEGNLLKYTKEVELNIQRIKETRDVSTVTPLPDSPEFSQRFMNLYWKIINNQSITPSEIEVLDSECFICTEEMTTDQKTLQCEECKKVTHFECASQWLKIHRSCPHCRREMLDPEEFPNLGQ